MASLTELDLSGRLGSPGSLTKVSLSGLTSLTTLDFSHNQLTEVNLSSLTSLTTLYLWDNLLTEINLSGLTSLEYLNLSFNQLTDISSLSGLISLTELNLVQNGMEINFNESTETTAGKNAKVIRDHIDNGCDVEYEDGNTVTP